MARFVVVVVALCLMAGVLAGSSRPASAAAHATAKSQPACDTSWTGNGGDGNFLTAGNWDNGVPTAASNACIVRPGTYRVTLGPTGTTAYTVGSLQIGATGSAGTQSLILQSLSCAAPGLVVTTPNGTWVQPTGVLDLTWAGNGACSGGESSTLIVPAGSALSNAGTIDTLADNAVIQADVVNTGSFDVRGGAFAGNAEYNSPGTTFDNQGKVTIAASSYLHIGGGATFFNDAGGTIAAIGPTAGTGRNNDLWVDAGSTFRQGAGVASGNPINLVGGHLAFTGSGASSFLVEEGSSGGSPVNPTLSGDVAAGQALVLQGLSCASTGANLDAAGGFTNRGTITLTWIGTGACSAGESSTLTLPAGATLTNAGTIETRANNATIQADVLNTGTLAVKGGSFSGNAELNRPATTFDNQGAVTIAASSYLHVSNGATFFNDTGGSISASGTTAATGQNNDLWVDPGSTFRQGGGTTTGNPVNLVGAHLDLVGGGASTFLVEEGSSAGPVDATVSGDVAAGQTIVIQGLSCAADGAHLDAPTGFTNRGTITMTWIATGACYGGESSTLTVPSGATLTNAGTIETRANNATIAADVLNTGTLRVQGGSFSGNAAVTGNLRNQGTVVVATTAGLTIQHDLTAEAVGTLSAEILGPPPGRPLIAVTRAARLAGTLNFDTGPAAMVQSGQRYVVLSDGSQTGSFDRGTGLSAGGSLAYDVVIGPAAVTASVVDLTSFPTAAAVNPASGPPGTAVTVFGSAFVPGSTTIAFGAVPATNVQVDSSTELTAVVPAGSGRVPVTVTTSGGNSSAVAAPTFTYATTTTGSPGSASLLIDVVDASGTALPGVAIAVTDATTRNPIGLIVADSGGQARLGGLMTGQTVQADVVATFSVYGPANDVFTLVAGDNAERLVIPVEPLVSSDATTRAPNGNAAAIWPIVEPEPNTTVPGGPLTSPVTVAAVDFTVKF
ncbi:MAG: IPT/TIG domain-containing protein, partial [Actinomycetota bacterium]|nr:IPT/TIG domain-containing protein [Actinomycetota bacterium]